MHSSAALVISAIVSSVIAAIFQSRMFIVLAGGLVSVSYLCALTAMYISEEDMPLRNGGSLTKNENPIAYRMAYLVVSVLGIAGSIVSFSWILAAVRQ